jgi:hypothetical protein
VPFDTWQVARKVLVVAAAAVLAVGVFALTRHTSPPTPASHPDVYQQLTQQLKRHLQPLAPLKATTKHAPTIQVPPPQGYSCEAASGAGCSLHPCVKYAQAVGAAVAAVTANRCSPTANATPRAVPIAAP